MHNPPYLDEIDDPYLLSATGHGEWLFGARTSGLRVLCAASPGVSGVLASLDQRAIYIARAFSGARRINADQQAMVLLARDSPPGG